jgi:hypothetical protein
MVLVQVLYMSSGTFFSTGISATFPVFCGNRLYQYVTQYVSTRNHDHHLPTFSLEHLSPSLKPM